MKPENILADEGFIEVETPFLIKSTPEGAAISWFRPECTRAHSMRYHSRHRPSSNCWWSADWINIFRLSSVFARWRSEGGSPTRYRWTVMSFVHRRKSWTLLKALLGTSSKVYPDRPGHIPKWDDLWWGNATVLVPTNPICVLVMEFNYLKEAVSGRDFGVFDSAETVIGICAKGCESAFSNKDLKELTEWVQRPQIGAKGLVYVKYGCRRHQVFCGQVLFRRRPAARIGKECGAETGDLLLILSGELEKTESNSMNCVWRWAVAWAWCGRWLQSRCGSWIFRYWSGMKRHSDSNAMHHPFTSPRWLTLKRCSPMIRRCPIVCVLMLTTRSSTVLEIGGGSIRIFDRSCRRRISVCRALVQPEAEPLWLPGWMPLNTEHPHMAASHLVLDRLGAVAER